LVNVCPLFVSNPQPPELIEPSEGPFDYPAPSPQSATVFGVALREPRDNAGGTQTLPDRLSVIATVAQNTVRTMPWASPPSLQAWDGVNQGEGLLRVVTIGSGQLNSKRNSPCVAD